MLYASGLVDHDLLGASLIVIFRWRRQPLSAIGIVGHDLPLASSAIIYKWRTRSTANCGGWAIDANSRTRRTRSTAECGGSALKKGQQQIPAYKPMVKPQTNQDWQQIAAGKVDHGLLPTSTSTDQPTLPVADHS